MNENDIDARTTPTESASNPPAERMETVEQHEDFKPAAAVPAPESEKTKPREKTPWRPKASISDAQLNDVLRTASAANKFRFDQVVAHRNDAGPLRLVKLGGNVATVRAPDGSLEEYPVAELFDPETAEAMAAQLAQPAGEAAAPAERPARKVRDQAAGSGPAGAVSILVALALALTALFGTTGCGNTTTGTVSGTTEQAKAESAITFAEDHAQPITTAAVTAFLLMQKDGTQRGVDAKYIYSGAQALNIFTTGVIPTADQLEATVKTFLRGDPRYNELAGVIVAEYANVYPLFGIAGKSPTKLLMAIEMGAMNGAKPFVPAG